MKAVIHEVDGKPKQGRPRMKWREQVEGNMIRIGLKKEDAANRCRWREGVRRVAEVVECIRPPPVTGDKTIKTRLMMMTTYVAVLISTIYFQLI